MNKLWQWLIARPIAYVLSAILFGFLVAPLVIVFVGSIMRFYAKYLALWGLR